MNVGYAEKTGGVESWKEGFVIIQSSRQGLKLLLHNWQMLETVTDGETLNGTVGFVFIIPVKSLAMVKVNVEW